MSKLVFYKDSAREAREKGAGEVWPAGQIQYVDYIGFSLSMDCLIIGMMSLNNSFV